MSLLYYGKNFEDDKFSKNVFERIRKKLPNDSDAVFIRPEQIHTVLDLKFTSKIILIAVADHITNSSYGYEFNYWSLEQYIQPLDIIANLARQHSDKKILLVIHEKTIAYEYLREYKNVFSINWNTTPTQKSYTNLRPVWNKNINSKKIGISLNRQMRPHRLALISLLYGLNLHRYCKITSMHMFYQFEKLLSLDFMDHCNWNFDENEDIRDLMICGFKTIPSLNSVKPNDVFPLVNNSLSINGFQDLRANFENFLHNEYVNSFIEITATSTFTEPDPSPTDDKYLNTVYGCNFPIMIASPGTIELYRQAGFDMFDDIVDHSYDLINDPVKRMYTAIEKNINLLKNIKNTITVWQNLQERFSKNIENANKNMYNYFENWTLKQIPAELCQS